MAAEFNSTLYNTMVRELRSYSSLAYFGEPEILIEGFELRNKIVDELKKKYPDASDGSLNFLVSYELDELARDPLHPEYELEALRLISS